jgi:transposase-like protein
MTNVMLASREVEVPERARRRRFTAAYKQSILRQAEKCKQKGELGALLRREGLYSSHLAAWRAARDRGELERLAPRLRGPKAAAKDARDQRIAELERECRRLQTRVQQTEALIEVQKKVSHLLGVVLPANDERHS